MSSVLLAQVGERLNKIQVSLDAQKLALEQLQTKIGAEAFQKGTGEMLIQLLNEFKKHTELLSQIRDKLPQPLR